MESVNGLSGSDSLYGNTGNDTFTGNKGKDTLTGGEGADVFVFANGDGNDLITDYEEEDILKFTSGTPKFKKSGKHVIITLGSGKIPVQGAADKTITYIDQDGKEQIWPNIVDIKGTSITLLDAYNKDTFDVATYDGDDVITDFKQGDVIQIASGTVPKKAKVSGKDYIFKIGKGSLTVKNAKGKYIKLVDANDNAT